MSLKMVNSAWFMPSCKSQPCGRSGVVSNAASKEEPICNPTYPNTNIAMSLCPACTIDALPPVMNLTEG